jgi:predicted transposase YdaD
VLVQVWSRQGREQWVLLHVEVQAQRDPEFPRRMFDYYSRICQRYNRPVASLAILADAHPGWKPARFQQALWGCESQLRFPVCKLLDLARAETRLLRNSNPFAIVVLAQIKALQTAGALRHRRVWKATLAKLGHERGYSRRLILDLYTFVDWVMVLSPKLEREVDQEIEAFEKAKRMKYITNMERRGLEKGLERGRQEGRQEGQIRSQQESVLAVLETRFGEIPYALREAFTATDDLACLKRWHRLGIQVASLAEFETRMHKR